MVDGDLRQVDVQDGEIGVDPRARPGLDDDLDALLFPDLGDFVQEVQRLFERAVAEDENQDTRGSGQIPNLPGGGLRFKWCHPALDAPLRDDTERKGRCGVAVLGCFARRGVGVMKY